MAKGTHSYLEDLSLIHISEPTRQADVNEDGSVDVLDVVLMVNILVGGLPQSN